VTRIKDVKTFFTSMNHVTKIQTRDYKNTVDITASTVAAASESCSVQWQQLSMMLFNYVLACISDMFM